ncbi:unnamed protein product [Clonostachys chloroleuca]|uniref:Zn(2)-C6 fungal-type domain-containing protein n=1 Tax=Clonostachys chloroleuca TaxID=1926264 RepID=A0AA35Q2M4_9HYPO|nr:unnamed protein product [Clonostachys chloroleuca]
MNHRASLRRSCDACAKSKHSCDLRTPQCSRCIKRKVRCVYANQPLTSSSSSSPVTARMPRQVTKLALKHDTPLLPASPRRGGSVLVENLVELSKPVDPSFDPFDSYPPTRLPRAHVQQLIHHFLSSIAFQYYPLDMNMGSNPFVVSWWPLALADPALFHVSLQTASLDKELRAQKGFPISDMLMMDSVSLVRKRIGDSSLAIQDETMNSVVTLAAIEFGKGNIDASTMHIAGVKRMVGIRGGINQVKTTSPLTARMVSWVSMIVMGAPQFLTQDDLGFGDGVGPILQWKMASMVPSILKPIPDEIDVDPEMSSIIAHLQAVFHQTEIPPPSSTELHDLTCFVVHKLLLLPPNSSPEPLCVAVYECLRHALVLYMLIVHGTTYYSHATLTNCILTQLKQHLETLTQTDYLHSDLHIWLLSIGMAASTGMPQAQWFFDQACVAALALRLREWKQVLGRLERILWIPVPQGEAISRRWEEIWGMLQES